MRKFLKKDTKCNENRNLFNKGVIRMKSNELFEEIHAGIIKDNSTIKVMTEEGQVITKIKYENKGLKWEQGKFDTKYLCDIDIEFEVEEPDIDIQRNRRTSRRAQFKIK